MALLLLNTANMGLPFLSRAAKKRDHIVVVDLGGRTTKAVYLQRQGESFTLSNYSIVDAPVRDKGFTPEQLAEHLKTVTGSLGNARSKQVTLALGVADTLFRQVEMPLMTQEDMRQMLKYNSKNYLQQDLPDHVFDCYHLPAKPVKSGETGKAPNTQKCRVIVGGARKTIIDDLHTAIRAAGLLPDTVFPGVAGPANALELAEPEIFAKETVALIDIGFKNTNILILDEGEIKLNRVVNIGGDRLTSGLSEAMGISYEEAESIKVGMPVEIQQYLEPVIHPLGRELRASIDFFETQNDKTVNDVYVSGGTARSEVIIQALQNELMVTCKIWNPTRSLRLELEPQKRAEIEQVAPQLTVAIGAAAAGF